MNGFPAKIMWSGGAALVAGVALLNIGLPGFVWKGLVCFALGAILVFIGGRNLFKSPSRVDPFQ